jgi:hypothetical protein
MFNVVVARLLGDHIAPEQRRYDTPNASSIGQPLRLHVNVPDQADPPLIACAIARNEAKTFFI